MRLLERWRKGRAAKAVAEGRDEPGADVLGRGTEAALKAPSHESAEALIDVLRKHGVAAGTTRPQGRKVRIGEYEGEALMRAIELWLTLDASPDRVVVRCGRRRVRVTLPSETDGAQTPETKPDVDPA
jgi:hypothetical protein